MTSKTAIVTLLLLTSFPLLAGCSAPPPAEQLPLAEFKKFDHRLSAYWHTPEKPQELRVEYWIQNKTGEPAEFQFTNSGRVCGTIQDPEGREVLSFPEVTAQVLGTVTLKPHMDKTFEVRFPRKKLGEFKPGQYEIRAWLCGHEEFRAYANFTRPEPSQ